MNKQLYLFDFDGTLVSSYMETKKHYSKVEVMNNVTKTLHDLYNDGKYLGIITNQAGVYFKHIVELDFYTKIDKFKKQIKLDDIHINVCFGWKNDIRRKPNPTMIYESMDYFLISDNKQVIFVGDIESDKQTSENAQIDFMYANEFFKWK